jgi:hypothetical protein
LPAPEVPPLLEPLLLDPPPLEAIPLELVPELAAPDVEPPEPVEPPGVDPLEPPLVPLPEPAAGPDEPPPEPEVLPPLPPLPEPLPVLLPMAPLEASGSQGVTGVAPWAQPMDAVSRSPTKPEPRQANIENESVFDMASPSSDKKQLAIETSTAP